MKLNILFEESFPHTCGIESASPREKANLERWYRKHGDTCRACDKAYDDFLDTGFVGEIPDDLKDEVKFVEPEDPGDPLQLIKDLIKFDPRQSHEGGKFGTGHVAGIKSDDSAMMAGLKAYRDRGVKIDPVTGKGVAPKFKDKCGYGHTCTSHPSGGPAWNYPMPDPVATAHTGLQRYNWMFQYSPTNTFKWPVSGMMGYVPKSEYEDYVHSKLKCPVCNGEKPGCDNPVAHEYGKPKPFCTEHLSESPYVKELMGKFGGEGLPGEPDPNKDYAERNKEWKRTRAKYIRRGDEVKLDPKKPGRPGTGELVGVVLEIDDSMEDRTHRVKWENPRSEALRVTWEDPKNLELLDA